MRESTVDADHKGEWATRVRRQSGEPLTVAHLVESRVNEGFVTNCGRTMYLEIQTGWLVFDVDPEHFAKRACVTCQ